MVKGGVGYIVLTKEGYSVEHKVCALVDDFRGEKLKSMGTLKKWSKNGTMCDDEKQK